jgi:hypothetical protein
MDLLFKHDDLLKYIEEFFPILIREQIRPGHEFDVKDNSSYSSTYTYYIKNSELEMEVLVNSKGHVFSMKIEKSILVSYGKDRFELEIQIFGGAIISQKKVGYKKDEKIIKTIDECKKEIHDFFFELYPEDIRDIKIKNLLKQ